MAGAAAAAFAAQVVKGRWFMAYGSFLIMSAAGATYIFAIYSKDIKSTLGYTQEQLNTVGFFKDVGANIGIHAGLIAEVTPPWLVLAIGAAMNLGGYLMLYLSVTGRGVMAKTPLWLVCLYIAVGANSQAFANTGALVTCVKNFPESRGVMLGLLKGFVGLSGAIFTQLYLSFYGGGAGGGGNTKPLILLVGWLPAAISVAFLATIRIIRAPRSPAAARREYRAFCGFLYVSLALAAYLLVVIVLQKRFRFTRAEYAVSAAVVFAALLAPFAIVLREEAALFKIIPPEHETTTPAATLTESTKPPPPHSAATTATARILQSLRPPPRGEDYTILQALVSIDMLLLFTATVFGVGGTLTAIDNMGQIGESLGYPQRSIATFVSLISIWNYLFVGDLSYADKHPFHDNTRWDTWGRFSERSVAYQPWIWVAGNHEIDYAPELGETTPFKPFTHRYPTPHLASGSPEPYWYSVKLASAHVIVLSSYSAFTKYTPQWKWLEAELKTRVNRSETPWLILASHSPWYNSNNFHYMEGEPMRVEFEKMAVDARVDLVFSGHVHAYERSFRVSNLRYNITDGLCTPVRDRRAPVYVTIGDGGNIEGLADEMTWPQPAYSAFREDSFGHAVLDIKNRTHAYYAWYRNDDGEKVAADAVWFTNRFHMPNHDDSAAAGKKKRR